MLNEREIQTLIKVWFEKATRERDPFSKFVFLWICFNAWLDHESGKETDREMINWLINKSPQESDLKRIYLNLRESERFNEALKILASMSPIYDSRDRRAAINIKDKNDFENIVNAIYRIRCNLFHGGKEAHKSRDQKLIIISNEILLRWVGGLLASWIKH